MAGPVNIDDIDREIIQHLQTDGRMPYSQGRGPGLGRPVAGDPPGPEQAR